jgi:hypothetical protein
MDGGGYAIVFWFVTSFGLGLLVWQIAHLRGFQRGTKMCREVCTQMMDSQADHFLEICREQIEQQCGKPVPEDEEPAQERRDWHVPGPGLLRPGRPPARHTGNGAVPVTG